MCATFFTCVQTGVSLCATFFTCVQTGVSLCATLENFGNVCIGKNRKIEKKSGGGLKKIIEAMKIFQENFGKICIGKNRKIEKIVGGG